MTMGTLYPSLLATVDVSLGNNKTANRIKILKKIVSLRKD